MSVHVWNHLLYNPHGEEPESAEAVLQRCVDLLGFINAFCYAVAESGWEPSASAYEGLGRLTLMLQETLRHVYALEYRATCGCRPTPPAAPPQTGGAV
jgi:hypothetical protein